MKNHADCKVTICGYADKQTGNANINMNLSKKRAEAVAAQLKEKASTASVSLLITKVTLYSHLARPKKTV